jgi:hypothetical protein
MDLLSPISILKRDKSYYLENWFLELPDYGEKTDAV